MTKAYIAGKVSRLPIDEVTQKFNDKQLELKAKGYMVYNPIEIIIRENLKRDLHGLQPLTDENNRKEIMRICIEKLLKCDEIHLLPDWLNSSGSRIEHEVALKCRISIIYPE